MKQNNWIKKGCYYVLLFLLAFWVGSVQADKRIALVIGNSQYQYLGRLDNPTNDAEAMAQVLQRLGFEVILKKNVRINEIGQILRDFRSRLNPGDETAFFYAGHGLEMDGENYLPAVDAHIKSKHDVPLMSFQLKSILNELEEAKTKVNLFFLDACRNNPLLTSMSRSGRRGLAAPTEVSGTLISYAAKHGTVASDGETKHSPYTAALLSELSQHPDAKIEDILKLVKKRVKSETNGEQEPWVYGSLDGDFYFILPKIVLNVSTSVVNNTTTTPKNVKIGTEKNAVTEDCNQLWNDVKNAENAKELGFFLKQCPQHKHVELAKIRQQTLIEQEQEKKKQQNLAANRAQEKVLTPDVSQKPEAITVSPRERDIDPLYVAREALMQGQEKQALLELTTILNQNPKEKGAYHLLHDIYTQKGQAGKLMQDLPQFIKDKNAYKIAYFHLGLVYQHLRLYDEMQLAFKKALQYDPRFFHPYLALRRYYLEQNQPDKANEAYQTARTLNPNLPDTPPQNFPPRREDGSQNRFFPREKEGGFEGMRFGPPPRFRP